MVAAAITYRLAEANLAATMDRVGNDREALIITRDDGPAVVVVSLEDFRSIEETAHLLRSPANAKRLLAAIALLRPGKDYRSEK